MRGNKFTVLLQDEIGKRRTCQRLNRVTPFSDGINGMLSEISNHFSEKFEQDVSIELFECGTYSIETRIFYNKKLSEIVILFDNFLSDVLLQFDILYIRNAKTTDYIKCWYKTLAEIQFGRAKYVNCIPTIQCYKTIQYSFPYQDGYPDEVMQKASKLSSIQHWFIIFHEIGHIFFNKNMINPTMIKNIENRLEEIVKNSFGDDKNTCDIMTKIILQDVGLIEECVCDSFACSMAFETYKVDKNYSLDEIAEAIYLATQNMKILSLAFDCADSIKTSQTSVNSVLRETFVANWIPMIYTGAYYGVGLDDEIMVEKSNSPICKKITDKINTLSQFYNSNVPFEHFSELINNYIEDYGALSLDGDFSNEEIAELENIIEMLI
jgi:predicted DNA-binding protein YlxM (UPF0122 family)